MDRQNNKDSNKVKFKKMGRDIKNEVDINITPFFISGFAFIVALVWRDFIRDVVEAYIDSRGLERGYLYSFLTALLVSLISIIVVLILVKTKTNKDKDNS